MSSNRSRWLINLVLMLALLAFVGLFTFPLLSSILKEEQGAASVVPVSTPSSPANDQSKLQEQARGYELVLQQDADNKTALRSLLDIRLQLGDLKGAIYVLDKLTRLNPSQTDYIVLLAQAKQQIGDREGAADAYRTVLTSKPGDMNALQGLVSLLLQQKRPEAAIGLLQDTLKTVSQVNPSQPSTVDTASIQLLLGQVYVNEQRYTEAIAVYDENIKYNKQDFRPVLAKAIVLQQLGKIPEAKSLFVTAISLAPSQYKDQIKQMGMETPQPPIPPQTTPTIKEDRRN